MRSLLLLAVLLSAAPAPAQDIFAGTPTETAAPAGTELIVYDATGTDLFGRVSRIPATSLQDGVSDALALTLSGQVLQMSIGRSLPSQADLFQSVILPAENFVTGGSFSTSALTLTRQSGADLIIPDPPQAAAGPGIAVTPIANNAHAVSLDIGSVSNAITTVQGADGVALSDVGNANATGRASVATLGAFWRANYGFHLSDVNRTETVLANADHVLFSDENAAGDPNTFITFQNLATQIRPRVGVLGGAGHLSPQQINFTGAGVSVDTTPALGPTITIPGGGSSVTANPSGTDGSILTRLSISGTNWNLPAAGSGGLVAVTSDATLTGDGTAATPLGVANPPAAFAYATGASGTIPDARIPPGVTRDTELADFLERTDIVGGTNVTATAGAGNVVTLSSTDRYITGLDISQTGRALLFEVTRSGASDFDETHTLRGVYRGNAPVAATGYYAGEVVTIPSTDGVWFAVNDGAYTRTQIQSSVDWIQLTAGSGGGGGSDDGVADSLSTSVSGAVLTTTIGRSGTLTDLTDTATLPEFSLHDVATEHTTILQADRFLVSAESVSGDPNRFATFETLEEQIRPRASDENTLLTAEAAGFNCLGGGITCTVNANNSVSVTVPTDDVVTAGSVSGTTLTLDRSVGTDVVITGLPSGGGGSDDGVADSVDLSLSGNDLTVTVGRSGSLADLDDTVTLPTGTGGIVTFTRTGTGSVDLTASIATPESFDLSSDIEDGELIEFRVSSGTGAAEQVLGHFLITGQEILALPAQAGAPATLNGSLAIKTAIQGNNSLTAFGHSTIYIWRVDSDTLYARNPRQRAVTVEVNELELTGGGGGGGGGSDDGVANSVSTSVSGLTLTTTVGRSGTLADLTDTATLPVDGVANSLDLETIGSNQIRVTMGRSLNSLTDLTDTITLATVPLTRGGTGATNAAAARTALDTINANHISTGLLGLARLPAANAIDTELPAAGELVPDGGSNGQILAKASGTDGDTEWIDAVSGGSADGVANDLTTTYSGGTLTVTVGRSGSLSDLSDTASIPAGDVTGIDAGHAIRIDDGSSTTPEVNFNPAAAAQHTTNFNTGDRILLTAFGVNGTLRYAPYSQFSTASRNQIATWARASNPTGSAPIGRGGTGATTAAGARTNLDTTNANHISSGTLGLARLPGANAIDTELPASGELVPSGGDDGQILAKASGTDGDTEWIEPAGGGASTVAAGNGISVAVSGTTYTVAMDAPGLPTPSDAIESTDELVMTDQGATPATTVAYSVASLSTFQAAGDLNLTTTNGRLALIAAFRGAYSSLVTYSHGDVVESGGDYWIATGNNVEDSTPSRSSDDWELLTEDAGNIGGLLAEGTGDGLQSVSPGPGLQLHVQELAAIGSDYSTGDLFLITNVTGQSTSENRSDTVADWLDRTAGDGLQRDGTELRIGQGHVVSTMLQSGIGLIGNPTATTQGAANDSTRIATTAFVHDVHLAADSITATQLAADSVGSSEIEAGAVQSAEIANDGIGTEDYAPGSVDTAALAAVSVTEAKIADDAVGVAQLKTATGTMSISTGSSVDFEWSHEMAFMPRVASNMTDGSNDSECSLSTTGGRIIYGSGTTMNRHSQLRRLLQTDGLTCTTTWAYITASDDPAVWAAYRTSDGVAIAVWEAEDSAVVTAPIGVPADEEGNALAGYTVADVGVPTLAVITGLYQGLAVTERVAALSCTGAYVEGRGWLDAWTGLASLSGITDRYEPSGRQWAMRCAAEAEGIGVGSLYMRDLVVSNGAWALPTEE